MTAGLGKIVTQMFVVCSIASEVGSLNLLFILLIFSEASAHFRFMSLRGRDDSRMQSLGIKPLAFPLEVEPPTHYTIQHTFHITFHVISSSQTVLFSTK